MSNLASMFDIVQQNLFSRKVNFNDILLERFTLTIPEFSDSNDYELIFMHSLVKRLIQQSNELAKSLSH